MNAVDRDNSTTPIRRPHDRTALPSAFHDRMNRTTRTGLLAAVLAVVTPAQDASTPQAALARAQLLEQQEGDLAQAEQAYRALLAAPDAAAVHPAAALRLGAMLWRLERREDARPLLEQAVAGGGAIAEEAQALLQGQGPDAQQEAARQEQARMLVQRLYYLLQRPLDGEGKLANEDREAVAHVEKKLDTIGASASIALAQWFGPNTVFKLDAVGSDRGIMPLSSAAWRIGHAPLREALLRVAEQGSVEARVFHAEAATRTSIAADMEPVLLRFAAAPDPTGEVWPQARNAFRGRLPFARLESLVQDDAPGVRAAALSGLAHQWRDQPVPAREALIAELGELIRAATRSDDRRVRDGAWELIGACLNHGPTAGTYLFFDEIDRAKDRVIGGGIVAWHLVQDDAWLQAAAAAAQRLGPAVFDNSGSSRSYDTLLALLDSAQDRRWGQGSVEAVITLLELGYGRRPNWWINAIRLADEGQLARLLRQAPRVAEGRLTQLMSSWRSLPITALPVLRELVGDAMRSASESFGRPSSEHRQVRGKSQYIAVRVPQQVLKWAADTKHPNAATWLGELAAAQPTLVHHCALLLADLADAKVVEALPPLRSLLVWEGNEENELNERERNRIFAALTKAGDVDAIPLFPRAYELGLADPHQYPLPVGIDFLCEGHGYQEAALQQCWQTLLDSAAAASVFRDLNQEQDRPLVPLPVLDLTIDRLIRSGPTTSTIKSGLPDRVRSAFAELSAPLPEASSLLAATRRFLGVAEPELAVQLFQRLPTALARQLGNEGLALLRRTGDGRMVYELTGNGIELTIDDWRTALQSASMRTYALEHLPAAGAVLGAVRPNIEALLRDSEQDIRIEACAAMQRLFGADAVPALLPLLQDQDEDVRKKAREALDQLRQDAEQRAFWREAGTGIDLRPQAAASKLLQQAKAGEPKEQRLLAVRSLAMLGAAEALPYLIDLTKDQDQELAAAARAAITAIHQRGAAPGATK